ncbi:Hypothetical predicted protein, partial [Drosophila guanche]
GARRSETSKILKDGKTRSIHQLMGNSIESIRTLHELVAIQLHDEIAKAVTRTHQSCQTSPLLRTAVEPKRKRRANQRISRFGASNLIPQNSGWNQVENRARTRKPNTKPNRVLTEKARPDAIIIAGKNPSSYAEILRKLKVYKKLQGVGDAVQKIRRTQKSEFLIICLFKLTIIC